MAQPGDRKPQRPVLPPPPPELAEADREATLAAQRSQQQAEAWAKAKQEAEETRRESEEARRAERAAKAAEREKAREERRQAKEAAKETVRRPEPAPVAPGVPAAQATRGSKPPAPARRTRRAQLRLVQVDAWSVMKTSFLLSIALGIVLVVAVAIVWAVLGAAGVWDSINSIVQQAVGNAEGPQFDITDYLGTSRVLGITMVVAVVDVILITAIATLGAFLYNLSAALLGGVEVTLAEDN